MLIHGDLDDEGTLSEEEEIEEEDSDEIDELQTVRVCGCVCGW